MSSSSRAELLAANSGPRVPKAVAARAAKKKAAAPPPAEPDPYKVDYEQHGYSQAGGRGGGGGYDEGYDDEYDPGRDNPLRQNEQLELEQQAVTKSKEVTGNLRNVLRIAEDTKQIGSTTLVTLKDQGEQIARTHEKVVQIDQELAKGERLLGKLGPMFSIWRPKKGKKIAGPQYRPDMVANQQFGPGGRDARDELFDNSVPGNGRTGGGGDGIYDHDSRNYRDVVEEETKEQDKMLDAVSDSLKGLKELALEMGNEMDRQDAGLDHLKDDVEELNRRQAAANKRGRRILGQR